MKAILLKLHYRGALTLRVSLLLIAFAFGCNRQGADSSSGADAPAKASGPVHASTSSFAQGRQVNATLDAPPGLYPEPDVKTILARGKSVSASGPLAIYPEAEATTVEFGNHNLRIEKEQVLVDGHAVATVPGSATNFSVTISNTTLTLQVTQKNIFTTNFSK